MINDDDFKIFPTRDSFGAGLDMERKMIAAVGGPNTIRTRIQENADGSTTMLKTRGGMPTFTTTQPPVYAPTITYPYAYLETGILADLRVVGGAATWKGLDIVGTGKYMKWVSTGLDTLGQHKSGSLDDGPSLSVVTDAKKDMAVKIPPSVFSGKMRLFIQSVYGAKDVVGYSLVDNGPMVRGISYLNMGILEVAKYPNRMAATYEILDDFRPRSYSLHFEETGAGSIELGFTSANSCGIFVSDNTYWLIRISREGTVFTVTAYPIVNDTLVDNFLTKLGGTGNTAETIAQCEAYLFAYCYPSIAGAITLGSYDLGAGGDGDPIAYGWKFNADGSEAKMVIHQLYPTTAMAMRWVSRTLTMSLAFDPEVTPVSAASFTCSITSASNGSWANPEPMVIYAPCFEGIDDDAEYSTRLQIVSIASAGASGDWETEVSDLPIYGFYSGSTWKALTMSRKQGDGGTHVLLNDSPGTGWYAGAPFSTSGVDIVVTDSFSPYLASNGIKTYSSSGSGGSASRYESVLLGASYDLKFSGQVVRGAQPWISGAEYSSWVDYPDRKMITSTVISGETSSEAVISNPIGPATQLYGTTNNASIAASVQSWLDSAADEAAGLVYPDYMLYHVNYKSVTYATATTEYQLFVRTLEGDGISAVIPCGDAEAVFLLQGRADNWTPYHHSFGTSNILKTFKVEGVKEYYKAGFGLQSTTTEVAVPATEYDMYLPISSGSNDLDYKLPKPYTESSRYLFKNEVMLCSREPDYQYFWRPQSAYFDDGMYSMTSVLDHFNCSEGPRSDNAMDRYQRFCGWI